MDKATTRTLADETIGTTADGYTQHLLTQVWYEKGGLSYATYKHEPRGYYLAVRIEERKREEGATITRFTMFQGGVKRHVLAAARFNARTLDGLAAGTVSTAESLDVLAAGMREKVLAGRAAVRP